MTRLLLVAGFLLASSGLAHGQDAHAPSSPWTYRLHVGGSVIGGNLFQIQLTGSGRLTYDQERVENQVIASGFRLWMRRGGTVALVGDDVTFGNLFLLRFGPRVRAVGFTYLMWSQLHQIDLRMGIGAGPMLQLFDGTKQSLRVGVLGFAERTAWPGTTFNRPIEHVDGVQTIPRVSLLGTSHLSLDDTPLSFRSLGYLHVNPSDVGDLRGVFRASLDLRITGALQISLSGQVAGSSVVLEGVRPVDTRMTAGFTVAPPQRDQGSRNTSANR